MTVEQFTDLLIEIGTEEMPPKNLAGLAEDFAGRLQGLLKNGFGLITEANKPHYYFSPRRLALIITGLRSRQPDQRIERFGPAINVAFDASGKPTRAAEGFARSCGTTVDRLEHKDGKLFFASLQPGKPASELIPQAINEALVKLSIPKRMRWSSGNAEFVRPVQWAVVLFGNEIIDCDILGVRSGNQTRGHRYHHPGPIEVNTPREYVQTLRDARVWLNDELHELQAEISRQAHHLADKVDGEPLNSDPDSPLVAEIAALVEWPVAIRGSFDPKFLALPEEVLIATLEGQQRYFPICSNTTGKLLPCFITIANIESRNKDEVRKGNERVIVPRLTDAMFFWQKDQSTSLANLIPSLDGIVFQNKLGTLGDKMRRVAKLAAGIARKIDGDSGHARRSAQIAKCDLLSNLVGEFPELQGIIGGYLAQHDGEPQEVARAIGEHYLPRFAGDKLPEMSTGRAVAIADKLDSIIGIFSIGQAPTGEKDPFALRRSALGVLRILIECRLDLDLKELLEDSAATFDKAIKAGTVIDAVFEYMMERLRGYYEETGAITPQVFMAVLARQPTNPLDFHQRIIAVRDFSGLPQAESLAVANKRIGNILKQAGGGHDHKIKPSLLQEPAEKQLAEALAGMSARLAPMFRKNQYGTALSELAGIKDAVDVFFDKVMVMCDDKAIKNNRLALLYNLNQMFLRIADISKLQI
ncbi:MAG: glycine--tRNA ligase subunit beta [Gammaproteobacteria bacterium]